MPSYSKASASKLATCHPDIQKVFNEVVKYFDNTILVGHRTKEEQDKAVREHKSQTPWPTSKHNSTPSHAVDVAPYPIDFNDVRRYYLFAGFVLGTAKQMGINLRWGGDWDMDTQVKDNHFNDLGHFELHE